jgi:hypothetical protein
VTATPARHGGPEDLETFAAALRDLRYRAGKPSYRELTNRTSFGRTVLSQALNGRAVPTWEVTRALVRALGGDEAEWRQRWARLAATTASTPTEPAPPPAVLSEARPEPSPTRAGRGGPFGRRRIAVGLATLVTTGLVVALVLTASRRASSTDTDPGSRAYAGESCYVVTARDVTVFTASSGEDSWAVWRTGTHFWADPSGGAHDRYRTPLRNGHHGWVTAATRYVQPATGCP